MRNSLKLNLKISSEELEQLLVSRIISLDEVGLCWEGYRNLVLKGIMPWPGKLQQGKLLTLSECLWFKIVNELKEYCFSDETISLFTRTLLANVYIKKDNADNEFLLSEGKINFLHELEEQAICTFYYFDILIYKLLKEGSDVLIQVTKSGKIKVVAWEYSENSNLAGAMLSFSLSNILSGIVGDANMPVVKTLMIPVSTPELKVIESLREPAYSEVKVEKAKNKANYTWDIITKEVFYSNVSEVKQLCNQVQKSYSTIVVTGQESQNMPVELFGRYRCR